MTLGTYSGGPSVDQLRVCVASVQLPKEKPKGKKGDASAEG